MKFLRTHVVNILILLILAAGAWLRAGWYGDLRLSIANAETVSYVTASKAPVFSWKIFAGPRLFTTNLLYKFANDEQNCPITSFGMPGLGEEDVREVQPCFDKIALLQNILAIIAWTFLAWMTARWLKNPLMKIAAATLIMVFGFTPQIAEWDSVLSPESLTLSIFAILLGMGLEIGFRAAASDDPFKSKLIAGLFAGWVILFLLWVFVRDVHLYAIPITLVLLALLFLLNKFRSGKFLTASIAILSLFLLIGYFSARDSQRATHFPLINALDAYIWPYPARVEYFREFGMPERDSNFYQEWADDNATKAYGLFLISHPGFVATTLWEELGQFADSFAQPYFFTSDIKNRDALLTVGEVLHPETAAVYLIGLLLFMMAAIHAIQQRTPSAVVWGWLAVWFFGIAAVTLLLSFFGDTAGTRRHIMPSVEMFRLFFWVFLLPFLDLSFARSSTDA